MKAAKGMIRTTKPFTKHSTLRCKECGHGGFWSEKLKRFLCFNFVGCESREYEIDD